MIRASGWQWNWGSRIAPRKHTDKGYVNVHKNKEIELVMSTLLHPYYDKFEEMRPLYVMSRDGVRIGDGPGKRTKVHWQNWMRSNVRHDNRIYTEQLTSY